MDKEQEEHIEGRCDWCGKYEDSDEELRTYADSKICNSCYNQVVWR